jgi:hypothetical protein
MPTQNRLIPIYTSRGDAKAFLLYPYLYNLRGEWIGWVTAERDVYSVHGHFVGTLSKEPRILRRLENSYDKPKLQPLPIPRPLHVPQQVPLAPMMAEVPQSMIDVLEDAPNLLPPLDFGELRQDMD